MYKHLALYGASWHGREVLQIALDCKTYLGKACFLDDSRGPPNVVDGVQVLPGSFIHDPEFVGAHRFIVTIGDNATRLRIGRHLYNMGGEIITLIHPSAIVWGGVTVDMGSVVFPQAVVSVDAKVGKFCIVNKHATVGHGAVMEDGSNICDSVVMSGKIGSASFMGIRAVSIPGVNIGARCTVGAGSVCIRNVPDDTLVVGVPARKI